MIIDIIALVLFCTALFRGWRRGLVIAVFSFLAFVIGLAAALKLSSQVAAYLGAHTHIAEHWLPVFAFLIVFIITLLLVRMGAKAIENMINLVSLGWLNRLCGVLFYSLVYLFIYSVILFYARQIPIFKEETFTSSFVYPYIGQLGPQIIDTLASILPFFRQMFEQLQEFFGSLSGSGT